MACFDLTQLESVHTKASSKIKRLGRSVSQRRMPRETEKPSLTMIDEKPRLMKSQLMEQVPARKIKTDMERWSPRIFLKGFCTYTHRTQTTNWIVFCQDGHGMMNVHFLLIEFLPTDFLRVSYTCSSDFSAYDGECTYTHLLHAHFLHIARAQLHLHIFVRVTHTHGSRVPKRFFAHVSHLSISLFPVSCLTHLCCCLTVNLRQFLTLTSTSSCGTDLS